MRMQLEFPNLDLGDTSPDELAAAIARLIEGGIELPDGILYTNDVRVYASEQTDELLLPCPRGPGSSNSPSLRSVV